jgi:hypothetical protein
VQHIGHHLIKELVDAMLFKVGLSGLNLGGVLIGNTELLD